MSDRELLERVEERARAWGVGVENILETQSSLVAFGRRGNQPVVLKVVRQPGDEWRSGEALEAFGGEGTVRVYEYVGGAVLLERLSPATPLTVMALNGDDDKATGVLAEVIRKMSRARKSPEAWVTVDDWGRGFDRYLAGNDNQIPKELAEQGGRVYARLCASQKSLRLLHGDLQHYNVLFDYERGWVSIDPKGVVGEVEYEIGASLRNPCEKPELFASLESVERRLRRYEARLKIDSRRALEWGFAQAVLSAVWSVEDGFPVNASNPSLMLANAIRPVIE